MTNLGPPRSWSWPIRVGVATGALALTVVLGRVLVMTPSAEAHADATYTVLYRFKGSPDGGVPATSLVRDAAGNLYGGTASGGSSTNCVSGCGTVFKLDTTGAESVLYSFTGKPDGQSPYGALVQDEAGNFYGTTLSGGASDLGTVFKLDTAGTETVLHSFTSVPDGRYPLGGLVRDAAGNLYGTTSNGGAPDCNPPYGCGTVFKLDTTGKETVLYSFKGGADGEYSYAALVLDAAGNLYGTTLNGGAYNFGTVFKLDAIGTETVLYSFSGAPLDGEFSYAGIVRDTAGNLYGTTTRGGASGMGGEGTVYKLDTTGTETVLHSFTGSPVDGSFPYAGLIRDPAGNLYGITTKGGASKRGAVFKVDATGKESILHNFNGTDGTGRNLLRGLIRDGAGNLYGTTAFGGGAFNAGTLFKISH